MEFKNREKEASRKTSAILRILKQKNRKRKVADLAGITILLAEDNELNAEITIELLKSRGAAVVWAKDGESVTAEFVQAAPGSYQIILMDIQMPKKDGIEAAKNIRQSKPADSASIPIIAMTANAQEEQKGEMVLAGMNDFLYKPLALDRVCICIKNWVG